MKLLEPWSRMFQHSIQLIAQFFSTKGFCIRVMFKWSVGLEIYGNNSGAKVGGENLRNLQLSTKFFGQKNLLEVFFSWAGLKFQASSGWKAKSRRERKNRHRRRKSIFEEKSLFWSLEFFSTSLFQGSTISHRYLKFFVVRVAIYQIADYSDHSSPIKIRIRPLAPEVQLIPIQLGINFNSGPIRMLTLLLEFSELSDFIA